MASQEAQDVFLAMIGMPKLPDVYAIFKPKKGWSIGGGNRNFSVDRIKVWTRRAQINNHLGVFVSRSANGQGLSRQERAALIPDDWYVVHLITRDTWLAKDFYLMAAKKKSR